MDDPQKITTDQSVDLGVHMHIWSLKMLRREEVKSCFGSKLFPVCHWRYDPPLVINTANQHLPRHTLYGEQAKQMHLALQSSKSSSGIILL